MWESTVTISPHRSLDVGSHSRTLALTAKRPSPHDQTFGQNPSVGQKPSRAAKRGGFQTGGFTDLDLSFLFCPFCPFWDFPDFSGIFLICSGMVRGSSRFFLFLFLGLLRAPTRNSPERVRDTIWTFPEKSGKHPDLETPRFSFSQNLGQTRRMLDGAALGTGQMRSAEVRGGRQAVYNQIPWNPVKVRLKSG